MIAKNMLWRCGAGSALVMGLLAALPAHAARILVLTTSETASDAVIMQRNCASEFTDRVVDGHTVDVLDGKLNNDAAPLAASDLTPAAGSYDIVVTCTVYNPANAAAISVISNAMATRTAQAFFNFDEHGSFWSAFVASKSNWTLTLVGNGGFSTSVARNTASAYSGSFAGLDPYAAHSFAIYSGVPINNAVYLAPGVTVAPTDTTTTSSVILVPTTESYISGGVPRGACLFQNTDVSGFDQVRYPGLSGRIAPAFINAAAPGGACGIPGSVSKAFSPTSVALAGISQLTLTIANQSGRAVTGLNLTDHLPVPLLVAGGPSTTCDLTTGGTLTANIDSNEVRLANAVLPATGCTVTVPVRWPANAAGRQACSPNGVATNTVLPGTDFTTSVGQAATPATATLACIGGPVMTITKTTSQSSAMPGDTVSYAVTVANTGVAPATNVAVSDPLPAGVGSGTWTCAGACAGVTSGTLPLANTLPSLAVGATATYTVNAIVANNAAAGTSIINTASVSPAAPAICADGNATCQASAAPVTVAAAIPALSAGVLGLLGIIVAWAAQLGLRRRAHLL